MIALVLCIGAIPIVINASAHAEEAVSQVTPASAVSYLWDEYKKPVKLTYGAQAKIQTTYLWRGLYAGGPNLQASANVGYGGLYVDLWWNIGTFDWRFNAFEPEVDLTLGFDRWGLNAFVLFVHNFNCPFFDFSNDPYIGNRLEVDVSYTLSPKIPLKILWASRVAAADSYVNDAGDTIRAFSSYLELSYNHHFPYGISLYGAVGMTPCPQCRSGERRSAVAQRLVAEQTMRYDAARAGHHQPHYACSRPPKRTVATLYAVCTDGERQSHRGSVLEIIDN